jgi:predicted acetyltransferase
MPITIRPVTADELLPWFQQLASTFFIWPSDPDGSTRTPWAETDLDRRIAAFDGDRIVGTYRTFGTELTLPGGHAIQASGVSAVSTRPTHRRQGILTQLVDHDIAACVDRGDAASVLYAAEWAIYGRFGYGPATWQARWTLRTRAARVLTPPTGSIDIVPAADARPIIPEVHRRAVARRAGEILRPDYYWDVDLGLIEVPGRPRWKGTVAVHRADSGEPDGYLLYHGDERWEEGIPDNIAKIDELVAETPEAELELWRYVAALDLTSEARAAGFPVDLALPWHLADGRAVQLKSVNDGLWLRPYDIPQLLGGRAYEGEGTFVLDVVDRLGERAGPASGRFRLEASPDGSTCRSTTDAADISLTAAALGAASLGGSRLADAVRSSGASEHRPGALLALDRLLRTSAQPWCSTFF